MKWLDDEPEKDPNDTYTNGEENWDEFRKNFVYKSPEEFERAKAKGKRGRYQAGRLSCRHPGRQVADGLAIMGHYQRTKQFQFIPFKVPQSKEEFDEIEKRVNAERKSQKIRLSFRQSKKSAFKKARDYRGKGKEKEE